jgi:putative transposase
MALCPRASIVLDAFECELFDRQRFRSHSEARMAVFHFIEGFYNPSRRHSALGYLSPIEYER